MEVIKLNDPEFYGIEFVDCDKVIELAPKFCDGVSNSYKFIKRNKLRKRMYVFARQDNEGNWCKTDGLGHLDKVLLNYDYLVNIPEIWGGKVESDSSTSDSDDIDKFVRFIHNSSGGVFEMSINPENIKYIKQMLKDSDPDNSDSNNSDYDSGSDSSSYDSDDTYDYFDEIETLKGSNMDLEEKYQRLQQHVSTMKKEYDVNIQQLTQQCQVLSSCVKRLQDYLNVY